MGRSLLPYVNCPNCGLMLYTAAAYSTTDACPRCERALSAAVPRRSLRRRSRLPSRGHRVRLGGGPSAPAAARRALVELAVPTEAPREKLSLLTSELVTNSVKYAPSGPEDPLDLLVGVSDDGLRVEVSDGGGGFQPARVGPNRDLTSGWGLYLVDALADRWGVARGEPTRVWFELLRPRNRREPRDSARSTRPQIAAARAALRRHAAPARTRGSSSQQRRVDEALIQTWLRLLNHD
jgi:serine/threonine-protein kinase RsbW